MGPPDSSPVHSFPLGQKLFNKTGVSCHTSVFKCSQCWQLRPSGVRTVCFAVHQCGSESKRDWAHDRNLSKSKVKMQTNSGEQDPKNSGARNSEFQNNLER